MFTNVLILAEGQTVFFGPPSIAHGHFASLGYVCPQYSNPAEYYLGLVNTDFEGHADIRTFISSYSTSDMACLLESSIQEDRRSCAIYYQKQNFSTPPAMNQFFVLMHRNTLDNIRNPGIYWVRLFMYVMLSFMVGTMYLSTNTKLAEEDIVSLLFYVQAFLVFMSVAVLPVFIEQRSVFLRERANNSLNIVSYACANFIAALPGIFLIALVSSVLVVYLAGIHSFGYFLLNLFLSLVVAESLMHVIGSAVPHYIIGIAIGAGIFGMFMLTEGFMVPHNVIPNYWIWSYYLAFHTYSFESFVYEHFHSKVSPNAAQILSRLGMLNVNVDRDMVILALYALVLQLIFVLILYKFHTGRR